LRRLIRLKSHAVAVKEVYAYFPQKGRGSLEWEMNRVEELRRKVIEESDEEAFEQLLKLLKVRKGGRPSLSLQSIVKADWLVRGRALFTKVKAGRRRPSPRTVTCPVCGSSVSPVVNEEGEPVCPVCGAVLADVAPWASKRYVSVPEELRPVVPGFEPVVPQVEKNFADADVPHHALADYVEMLVKGLDRSYLKAEVLPVLTSFGYAKSYSLFMAAKAVEEAFWSELSVPHPLPFLPRTKECPLSLASVLALASLVITELERLSLEDFALSAYYSAVNSKAVAALVPFMSFTGKKASVGELSSRTPLTLSCHVRPKPCTFLPQLSALVHMRHGRGEELLDAVKRTCGEDAYKSTLYAIKFYNLTVRAA